MSREGDDQFFKINSPSDSTVNLQKSFLYLTREARVVTLPFEILTSF